MSTTGRSGSASHTFLINSRHFLEGMRRDSWAETSISPTALLALFEPFPRTPVWPGKLKAKMPLAEITAATRHLFLCVGPDYCDPATGEALWNILKFEPRKFPCPFFAPRRRASASCKAGPWLVVYPDGIWYGKLDVTKLRRIFKEHVEEGRPVRVWVAAKMPNLAKDS